MPEPQAIADCCVCPWQVLLDVQSIAPDRILLLDSYFYVVVFHGTTIAQWRKAEYHLQPEHVSFKALLEVGFPIPAITQPRFNSFNCCLQKRYGGGCPRSMMERSTRPTHKTLPACLADFCASLVV